MYTPALRWDNLQETHGQPPPSHPTLIFADLCGSGFHRSNALHIAHLSHLILFKKSFPA
ncbi:hypothetical protein [Oligosphaera ethanolica]|uniref:Uncharacterized protein n=1 Tax=Oligosphaera ethanolica TaxID=760260 RepID=A0AAE4AN94_9BACT|nr:hypothetical protein [Oligosphaera ethanolica]MDQ0288102.1 hypothetical protein [Oligosphaera ethanolica]